MGQPHAQNLLLHPPSLTGLANTDCPAPQGKLLPHAKVHEMRLVVQLLKDDVLPLPLVQRGELCLQVQNQNSVYRVGCYRQVCCQSTMACAYLLTCCTEGGLSVSTISSLMLLATTSCQMVLNEIR